MAQFVTSGTYDSGSSSLASHDFTVDCSAGGSNRLLVVKCYNRAPGTEITSATADGNAMTAQVTSENTNVCAVRIYTYLAPDDSVNVSIGTSSFKLMACIWELWDGVNQTTPVEATSSTGTFAASVSHGTTTLTNGAYVSAAINCQNARTLTATDGATETQDFDPTDANQGQAWAAYKLVKLASDAATGASFSSTDNFRFAAIAIKPSSAASDDTMASPLFGHVVSGVNPSATVVRYAHLAQTGAGNFSSTTESPESAVFGTDTFIADLRVELGTAPGSGKSWAFAVMRNGIATGLAVTISDTSTSASISGGTIMISPGDVLTLRSTPSGTPTLPGSVWWHMTSRSIGQSLSCRDNSSTSSLRFIPLHGRGNGGSTTEGRASIIMPTGGTITRLFAYVTTAPGAGTSKIFTLRVNASSSSLTTTVSNTAVSSSDTTNSVTVAAGDRITMQVDVSGAPAASTAYFALLFTPTTAGESFIGFSCDTAPSTSATEYTTPLAAKTWTTTETDHQMMIGAWRMTKFYARTNAASGAGTSYDLTVRKNAANSALTVNMANTTTVQSITSNVDLAVGDKVNLASVPNSTPGAVRMNSGILVTAIPAAPSTFKPKVVVF